MKKRLDLALNVAVLLAVGMMIASASRSIFFPPRPAAVGVHIGTRLPHMTGVDWEKHELTLVLAIRKGCHFCEDSMPLYRQLSSLQETHRLKAHVTAVLPDIAESAGEFLRGNNVTLPFVGGVQLRTIEVTGTPTILLVNRQGEVKGLWVGVLSREAEQQLLHSVGV